MLGLKGEMKMKTFCKKALSVILVVSFCASLLLPVSADSLKDKDSKSNSENKKIVCTATLEDDFADDSVIIVI